MAPKTRPLTFEETMQALQLETEQDNEAEHRARTLGNAYEMDVPEKQLWDEAGGQIGDIRVRLRSQEEKQRKGEVH